MNFKKFIVLQEMDFKYANMLPTNVINLVNDSELPFDQLFGKNLRVVEPISIGMKRKIEKNLRPKYHVDFDKWHVFKTLPGGGLDKNPIKLGKALMRRKEDIDKILDTPRTEGDNTNVEELLIQYNEIIELLKVSNLQKQVQNAGIPMYVVYSRAPMDIARMSDFDWSSCHSPGNDYFKCAMADAMNNAAIAYLVSAEDAEYVSEHLNDDEVFNDDDRQKRHRNKLHDRVNPLARVRIRAVSDSNGTIIAVPSPKIYGTGDNKFNRDFVLQVEEWALRQDVSDMDWDNVLKLLGGSYEDYGVGVVSEIKKLWGKDISISHDRTAERELENDYDFDNELDNNLEQMLDALRHDISESKIINEFLGDHDFYFDCDFDNYSGDIVVSMKVTDEVMDELFDIDANDREAMEEFNTKLPNGITVKNHHKTYFKFEVGDVNLEDFVDMGYDTYDVDGLHKKVAHKIDRFFDGLTGHSLSWGDPQSNTISRMEILNALARKLKIEKQMEIGESFEDFFNEYEEPISYPAESLYEGKMPPEMDKYNYVMSELDNRIIHGAGHRTDQENYHIKMKADLYNRIDKMEAILANFIEKTYGLPENSLAKYLITSLYVPVSEKTYMKRDNKERRITRVNLLPIGYNQSEITIGAGFDIDDAPEISMEFNGIDNIYNALESFRKRQGFKPYYDADDDNRPEKADFDDLDRLIEGWGKRIYFGSDPNQLEFDLSSVNNSMNQFDEFLKAITEGLGDMGKGPMASGGIQPATAQQSGQAVQTGTGGAMGGTQPKHSANGVAATPTAGGVKGNAQTAQNVIGMYKTNPQQFQQELTNLAGNDPDTFNLILQQMVPGPPPAAKPTI